METFFTKSGNYKVEVDYSDCEPCPATDWDMAARHYGESGRSTRLFNAEQDFGKSLHYGDTLLQAIADEYVKNEDLIKFAKKNKLIKYDKHKKGWIIDELVIESNELNDCKDEILNIIEHRDIEKMLSTQKDIVFVSNSSRGYCQGDYYTIYSVITKDRFKKLVDYNTKNWKKRAIKLIENEQEILEMWTWGDVKKYTLYKKRNFTKKYQDTNEEEEDFEYEKIDSLGSQYIKDEEEVAKYALSENDIEESL